MKRKLMLAIAILSLNCFANGTGDTGSAGASNSIAKIQERLEQITIELKSTTDVSQFQKLSSEAIALAQELQKQLPPTILQPASEN